MKCFFRWKTAYTALWSPSMRREWIEMGVLLLGDGSPSMRREWIEIDSPGWRVSRYRSPSMRREWIEIHSPDMTASLYLSPSMRREWIEMFYLAAVFLCPVTSPSMRREWIEITNWRIMGAGDKVSLHAEGVD